MARRRGISVRVVLFIVVAFVVTGILATIGIRLAMEDPQFFDEFPGTVAENMRRASGDPPRTKRPLPETTPLGTKMRIAVPDWEAVARDIRLTRRRGPENFQPTSMLLERTLPSAAFAFEAGQSPDPRVPPGPFHAAVEVTFRPHGDPMGRIGATITGTGLTIERNGTGLHADAAGSSPRLARRSDPVWMTPGRERITWTVKRSSDRAMAFRAERTPQATGVHRPIPSAGYPVVAQAAPDLADGAWPPPQPTWPIDALIHALDVGRCTACHAFHARRPGRPTAPNLAESGLTRSLPELILGLEPCAERAQAAGFNVPDFDARTPDTIARLLMQAAGRLPSVEVD
ncbi:MAG: hypothetical protein AB8G96_16685 [Phycisphaerales bacterium]